MKTTVRYYFTHIRITIIKTENKCWQGCREIGTLCALLVGMENGAATVENSLMFLQNIKQNYHNTQ